MNDESDHYDSRAYSGSEVRKITISATDTITIIETEALEALHRSLEVRTEDLVRANQEITRLKEELARVHRQHEEWSRNLSRRNS